MIEFKQLVSVNFQGTIIVFGRPANIDDIDIYFNVLGEDAEKGERRDWTGFTRLEFTKEVRQAGMGIITFRQDSATMVSSAAPFRVVADQSYISVVQQSAKGTLYISRFRLLKTKSGTDQKTTTYALSPAWEVRYARSGKEDVPADPSDTQEFLDPDGEPFLEPALELSMIDGVKNGDFDVLLLPVSGKATFAWQFLVADRELSQMRFFNFPASSNGFIDMSGKPVDANYEIQPDACCTITTTTSPDSLAIQGPPRAVVYVKHEKVVQPDGSSIGVKRASRAMITVPMMNEQQVAIATLDSAVAPDGTLARINGPVAAADIQPTVFDLVFASGSYLQLVPNDSSHNPLSITGPFSLRFMIAPAGMGDGLRIIGGQDGDDAKKAAPFVRIVDGDKLEVGFGTGDAAVACRTLHQVMFPGTWTSVAIDYAGVGDDPFKVVINGTAVALSGCSAAAEPGGTPIALIGAAENGFAGALNQVEVVAGDATLVALPCNSVDYGTDPPTTPNTASSGVVAQVWGAKNEPSSSPIDVDMSGTFHIDDRGITYYAALASFIQPSSGASLIDGSDGLLHLYYRGAGGLLTVAQFSTAAARATFYAAWTTGWGAGEGAELKRREAFTAGRYMGWMSHELARVSASVLVAPDNSQTGFLNFVAHRVGTYMNGTRITIGPSAVSPLLCDVTVEAPKGVGTERWRGLPRSIDSMSLIWNGAGSNSPDAQGVLDQKTPYFDYRGSIPAVLCPTTAGNGSYFLFLSVPLQPVTVASLAIGEGAASGLVDIAIEITAPPNWQSGELLKQSWPNVPADPRSILDIFAGKSTHYDYAKVVTDGTRAYGLELTTARSDVQIAHLLLFVKNSIEDFSVTVADGATAQTCDVTICGFSLPGVGRKQDEFAAVLNGASPIFRYPDGYKDRIATAVFALPNGITADVVNRSGPPEPGGAFAYAGLVRVLFQGTSYEAPAIATLPKTAGRVIQSASLTFKDQTVPIGGSMLFGAVVVDRPTDGGVGRLADTAAFSEGRAPVLMPGVNGGWMPVAPAFSLELNAPNKTNQVSFDVDKNYAPSDRLAISGDLTVQGWLKPRPVKDRLQARALTYNVVGNLDHPDLPIAYMMGLMRGPALIVGPSTYFTRSFNFRPPALTVQIYVKLPDAEAHGTIFTVSEVMGSTEFLTLGVDEFGKAVLRFLTDAGSVETASALPVDAWTCLTATVADAGGGQVALALYVDGAAPATAAAANSFAGNLGALTVGSTAGDGIGASLNGVAFWQRALNETEVRNSFSYGFPDNDPMLGIRWNLAEGAGTRIVNSAATGADYDTDVVNPLGQSWEPRGAFDVPYAGRNELILVSNRIIKGWTNIALASRQGRALALDGSAYGKVEDGSPFNPGQSLAIEAWIAPKATNSRQVIVEKPGSYSFYINTLGQVVLKVIVSQPADRYDMPPIVFTHEIKAPIQAGKTSYVAVNFTTGTVKDDKGSDQYVSQKYYIYSSLFINGDKAAEANKSDYQKAITVENTDSSFFLGMAGDETFNFQGLISHVRVWSRTLDQPEILRTFDLHSTPMDRDGLTAGWDFNETSGTVAKDITGNNDLEVSSNQLWTIWQDVAQADLLVNGNASLPRRLNSADVGGYRDLQFTLGGAIEGTTLTNPYSGEIDDVRLFSTLLTGQQVAEGMHKWLTGAEPKLAAYWMVDSGSGAILFDSTGRGNNGTLLPTSAPPAWRSSSAPIHNEGQSVVNAIGGQADYQVAQIEDQPSVAEFASAEIDAYGKIYSVMKRGYFFRAAAGENELETGYKVGDLDTIFVGQVQSKPTIVGYIEGGPPIPSENQTLAYWYGDGGGPAAAYSTVSSVTFLESETVTWSYSGTQSSTFFGGFNLKGGFYQKSKSEVSVGLGAEAETQMVENTIKLGLKTSLSGELGGSEAVNQSHSSNVSLSTSMTPSGRWEPADFILNPVVGRRYIQNNVGLALVKSATADMYMLALKGTQTPVGYTVVPNETIPVDTNLIDFAINPHYVKNGTLDGKIGLVNDPDYPNANDERGSYFKPLEAYAIKRSIEKEEQQLKAYYSQFNVDKYRLVGMISSVKDKLKENRAYDFNNNLNQRSIYCNYVWSAVGGLHKEEHSVANTYSETYVGASSLKFGAGFEIIADIGTPFGGYYIETDVMLGNTWTMTATRSEATVNGFQLLCNVRPTDFLPAPIITTGAQGQLEFKGYGSAAAPGKVDAYRFMSFLLAPSKSNFSALGKIVDQNWLANSTTASANAMREALSAPSEPWRIMYRTTFVSRVPAAFQPVKDETNAPNVVPPANLAANYWLVAIIGDQLDGPAPTPLEIGKAIDIVLGDPAGDPGLLKDLIPWWADFYAAARQYGTDTFRELSTLRVDLLDYMLSKYAAERYALGLD